jgi:hypothetical protein
MQALKPRTGMTGLKKYFRRQAFADVSTGHDPIDPARSPGLRPFLVAFVVTGLLRSADAIPQPLDVVRPTAVAIVHTQPRADVCWTSDDEEDRDADALNTIVMRAIEALKAVLTAEQRVTLARLLVASPPAIL